MQVKWCILLYVKKNGVIVEFYVEFYVLKILGANEIQWSKICETLALCIALNFVTG